MILMLLQWKIDASIQQSEESNCWLEQSPENQLYQLFRSFWATLYNKPVMQNH